MKKFTKNKKIIIFSIFIIFIFNTVFAETFEQNGVVFMKGEHQPEQRVFENEDKYKTLKALEVYKQPAHGKELPLEETEEYIESQKDLFKIQQVNSVFNQSNEIEKKTLFKETPDVLDNLDLESKPKSIFSIIIDSIKKLWNTIFNIIFRLENVEKRLDSLENDNEGGVEIRSIEVDPNSLKNIEIQNIDIQVEENSEGGDSDDEEDSRQEEDAENNEETSNSDTIENQDGEEAGSENETDNSQDSQEDSSETENLETFSEGEEVVGENTEENNSDEETDFQEENQEISESTENSENSSDENTENSEEASNSDTTENQTTE